MTIRLDLEQNSPEWHSWRKTRLTATDTAKINGESPYGSPYSCYMEKTTDVETTDNKWMKRGRELEPVARDFLISVYGINLEAACFDSSIYPFMGASIDAISDDNKIAWEIKCLGLKNHEEIRSNKEPFEHYKIQVQKQMLVLGLDKINMLFFVDETNNFILEIKRDDDIIKEIIEKEKKFWNNLVNEIPPEMSKKDMVKVYNEIVEPEFIRYAEAYNRLCAQIKELEGAKKDLRNTLLELAGEKEYKGSGITISSCQTNTVDYKKMILDYKIDKDILEKYTKSSITWKIIV